MHKGTTHWIVTANFTADGSVAYLKEDGSWGARLADARLFLSEQDTQPFVREATQKEQFLVCDPYGIDVHVGPSGIETLTAREAIRARGPSVRIRRPDNGLERLEP